MELVTLFSEVRCAPAHVEAVHRALLDFVRHTRAEPGCLVFELAQHKTEPHRFALYEVFRDDAAMQAHAQAPHLQAVMAALKAADGTAQYDFWNQLSPLAIGKTAER